MKALEEELENLKVVKRKEVAGKIKEAREQGDLSENAEYDAAKDEQRDIEARIEELEGILKNETSEKNVTFTLTPIQPLTEALETQEDVIKALGCTEFKAVNDLSEEVFKFDFKNDTNNVEIFEIKEKEKVDILNNFVKECKDCQKYMTPKEIVAQAAMWYYDNNRLACDKLGMCVCNIENQLATVIDQIDLTPLIENAEPEK